MAISTQLFRAIFTAVVVIAASHGQAATTMNEGARSKPRDTTPKGATVKNKDGSTSTTQNGVKTTVTKDGVKMQEIMPNGAAVAQRQRDDRDRADEARRQKKAQEARDQAWQNHVK